MRRVVDHPLLHNVRPAAEAARDVAYHLNMLAPFITPETVYLEVGAGDCAVFWQSHLT